jgi:hypothetical protein
MTEITKTRFTEDELDNLLDQLDLEQLDLINRYVDPDVSLAAGSFPQFQGNP